MLLEMNVNLNRGSFDLSTQLAVKDATTGLFGASGAGKSTLLGLIAGTLQSQTGQIVLEGKILFDGNFGDIAKEEGLHDYLGVRQIENVISVSIQSHDIEAGCTLAKTYGIELALPLCPNLPVDSVVQVSVRSSDIALSRHYLAGISIQNQIKGRICALVSMGGSILVQIDCGNTMLAGITHRACRDMALQEGDTVVNFRHYGTISLSA